MNRRITAGGPEFLSQPHRIKLRDLATRACLATAARAPLRKDALALARALIGMSRREGTSFATLLGEISAAGLAALTGDRAAARKTLIGAVEVAESLGMAMHAAAAEVAAHHLDGPTPSPRARAWMDANLGVPPLTLARLLAPGTTPAG